ncbi:MAG TPA: zinc ribbon domain-containing protein [Longimicrobiales bacterium]|nr:zinc ribbon domain-containing protein [Longimicrobiales bacterium]
MPLYEYNCRACSARFELLRPASERLTAPACPACGEALTSLVLSVPAHVRAASAGPAQACATEPGSCCGGVCLN